MAMQREGKNNQIVSMRCFEELVQSLWYVLRLVCPVGVCVCWCGGTEGGGGAGRGGEGDEMRDGA